MAAQPSLAAQRALPYASPSTIPLIQRSQYLADALSSLNQQGSQGFQSWGGLGASLLADAILQHKRTSTDAALTGASKSDMANLATAMTQGMGGAAAAPVAPEQAAPAPPLFSPGEQAPDKPTMGGGMGLSPADSAALGNAVYGEARGEPPEGQQAVASVILNRAHQSGQPVSQVVAAPHQFSGYDPNRQADPNQLAAVMQNIGGLADGSMPPTTTADHFYAPQGMPNGQAPSWAQGQPAQTIGHQQFLTLNGSQQPQVQPISQPMGQASQAASQGPAPQPMAQLPQAAPQQPQGIPTGPGATPQELALVQSYLHSGNPSLFNEGLALAQKIRDRQAAPIELAKGDYWDPKTGQARSAAQFQDVAGPENAFSQRGPDGQLHVTARPDVGSVPSGMQLQNGRLVPIQGSQPRPLTDLSERARMGISAADHNAYAIGPDGKVTKTADAPYGPTEIQSMRQNFFGSDETKKAMEGISAYNGLTSVIHNMAPSGVLNTAAIDSYLRGINPGMGAKNGTVSMFLDHIGGVSQGLREHILSHFDGKGYLTPDTLQNMVQVVHDYTASHRSAALSRAQQDAAFVAPFGYGPKDLAEDIPDISAPPASNSRGYNLNPQGANSPPPTGGPGGPGAGTYSRDELLAEAKRRGLKVP